MPLRTAKNTDAGEAHKDDTQGDRLTTVSNKDIKVQQLDKIRACLVLLRYVTLRGILCPAYSEPDEPGIANVTKKINKLKAS